MSVLLIASPDEYQKIVSIRNNRNSDYEWEDQIWDDSVEISNIMDLLWKKQYDAVVVAVKQETLALQIGQLIKAVSTATIVDFFDLYQRMMPTEMVERVMCNPNVSSYDGMILGLSHAEVGILPSRLDGNWCNLAVSSQDIYYNMRSFEYCLAHYPDKIKELKYLIIDMFDYTYFNYDVSLGKNAFTYYTGRGLMCDGHHFDENPRFDFSFVALKQRMQEIKTEGLDEGQLEWWQRLFIDPYAYNDYQDVICHFAMNERVRVVSEEDVKNYFVTSSITKNVFEHTIQENIMCLRTLLKKALELNPDMQIYFLILPQYAKAVKKARASFYRWKDSFYKIIGDLQKEFSFQMLDCKLDEMSESEIYFQDIDHLNYYGAQRFTDKLSKMIDCGGR